MVIIYEGISKFDYSGIFCGKSEIIIDKGFGGR